MDLLNLLNVRVWLNTNPGPLLPSSEKIVIAAVIILFILVFVSKKLSRKETLRAKVVFWQKFSSLFFWIGLALLVVLFFSREGIPFLGMRLWYLVLLAAAVVWLGFIVRYVRTEAPKQEELKKDRERFNKYLPKKKKRK